MSGETEISAPVVRLVRCPNCGKLLPEIANIPVYQCGGCNTTLQAKNRGRSRTSSKLSDTQPEPTPLQSDGIKDNCTEGYVQESNGNAQKVDESRSQKERTQNSTTEVSCSDDSSQRPYRGRSCEKAHCRGVSDECLLVGEEQEIDLVQSRNSNELLGIHEKKHKHRPPNVQSYTERLSDTHNPLSDTQFRSRAQAVHGSDGPTNRLYNSQMKRLDNSSGSGSSGELFDSPHHQGKQSSTHSGSIHEEFSNSMLSYSMPNASERLQNGDRGIVRPPWNLRHFNEEAKVVEIRANDPVFEKKNIGLAPKNGRFLGKKVEDFIYYSDYPNRMKSEADHPLDQMRPGPFDMQSEMTESSFDSLLTSQTNSTQSEVRPQTREPNIDLLMNCQKPSQLKWQSQERERNCEARRGVKKIKDLQSSYSFQSSQHGTPWRPLERDEVPGIKERRPHLLRNMPTASDRSEFYNHPRGLSQFNHEDYDSEKFDYSGNLSGFHETEKLQNEPMEILRKVDELREQLIRSCVLPHASNVRVQHNIGRTVVTPETKHILMENRPRLIGHPGVFMPADNYEESLTWGDDSIGSKASLGKLAYHPQIHSTPNVGRSCVHQKYDLLHGLLDEQDKEFHSKHPHPQNFGQKMSRGSYVEKRAVPMPYRIPHYSCSGEEQLKDRYQSYSASHEPVDMSKNTFYPCSRHHSRHSGTCVSQSYHDQHSLQMPSHVSPTVHCHQHMHNAATNQVCFRNSYPTNVRVQAASAHQHPSYSYSERSHGQRSMELESELLLNQQKKYAQELEARKWRTFPCSPFVGGAPFILCDNCLQLLLIPGTLSTTRKKKHRLRCGACSNIFVFTIREKRHSISMSKRPNYPSQYIQGNPCDCQEHGIVGANHASSCNAMLANERYVYHSPDLPVNDYDVPISKTHSASGKLGLLPPIPGKPHFPMARADDIIEVCCVQDLRGQDHDSLPINLHDTTSSEALNLSRGNSNSTEGYSGPDLASSMAVSPLHELLGYSSPSEMINKGLQETRIVASHQKRANSGNSNHAGKTFDLNDTKILNKPTGAVSPPHTYSSLGNSEDTMVREHREVVSKESGRNWNTTITGFLKKSIRDLKRSNQGSEAVRPKVSVNCRPIPDHLVKKAEEYAGPIHPGDYWYDNQAGFWGLMGGPCLSMIPPFIEEFNYPMPTDCAGGKTRVLVNGRELHQKDLDLLSARGLPTTKDKAYHIEIGGRVVDKDTNIELKSLGKLAPTLEKTGRGFGMRTPRKKS